MQIANIYHDFRLISIICLCLNIIPAYNQPKCNYEIFAIKFGERTHKVAYSEVAIGSKSKDSTAVYFMFWLLKGNNSKNILIDAGFNDDMEINPRMIKYSKPDSMLKPLQLKPADITDIIITHPHWDHIGGIDLFPNAHVWMQQKDYEYFIGTAWQKGGNNIGYNEKDVLKIVQRNIAKKLTLIQGDNKEIIPGIKVFTGSKHTFESQFVLVQTNKRSVIIASDNAWYYYNIVHELSIPITFNSKAYINNLRRMKKMINQVDYILPGHDPLVFSKFIQIAPSIVRIEKFSYKRL